MRMYRSAAAPVAILLALTLQSCWEAPPMESEQIGYRGVAMWQTTNPDLTDPLVAKNQVPTPLPPAAITEGAPKAGDIYQNVQVLGDLSIAEFTRTMASITAWVSPEQGCAYCHQGANFADDTLYTKVVSRRMMQMTQTINSKWSDHVKETGVTCYTCHRGNNVPEYIWFENPSDNHARGQSAGSGGQNNVSVAAGYTSMLGDPLTPYLVGEPRKIRIAHENTLRIRNEKNSESMQALEGTWSLMMHMSDSLGVNCTYCHNSRNFASWEQSPPTRVTAWHGLQMVPSINNTYNVPLLPVYPDHRLGRLGDAPKTNCATCHQGIAKPLYGVSMLDDYPVWREPLNAEATIAPDFSDMPEYQDPNDVLPAAEQPTPAVDPDAEAEEPTAGLDVSEVVDVAASSTEATQADVSGESAVQ